MEDGQNTELVWHKVLESNELDDGRVKPVTCAHKTVCLTRVGDRYGALDNKCPHQGGPLVKAQSKTGC